VRSTIESSHEPGRLFLSEKLMHPIRPGEDLVHVEGEFPARLMTCRPWEIGQRFVRSELRLRYSKDGCEIRSTNHWHVLIRRPKPLKVTNQARLRVV
jgi:hypothetical protein